jgi:hypothetical protein
MRARQGLSVRREVLGDEYVVPDIDAGPAGPLLYGC